jgi:hypothetical protein
MLSYKLSEGAEKNTKAFGHLQSMNQSANHSTGALDQLL